MLLLLLPLLSSAALLTMLPMADAGAGRDRRQADRQRRGRGAIPGTAQEDHSRCGAGRQPERHLPRWSVRPGQLVHFARFGGNSVSPSVDLELGLKQPLSAVTEPSMTKSISPPTLQ